ncbi:MAG: cupredoxin domain-containing protein [Nitrospirota bacterium]
MKKLFLLVAVLFLPVFVSSYCYATDHIGRRHHKSRLQQKKAGEGIKLSGKLEDGIRVIEVKASRYKFDPDPIVVKLGEKVRLVVTSVDVAHGIAIQEFNVKLSISAGKTERIEFVADKQGRFHAYCSVYCGPGHGRMQGILKVVED